MKYTFTNLEASIVTDPETWPYRPDDTWVIQTNPIAGGRVLLVADGVTGEVIHSPLKTVAEYVAPDNGYVLIPASAATLTAGLRYTVVLEDSQAGDLNPVIQATLGSPAWDAANPLTTPSGEGANGTITDILRGGLANWISLLGKIPDLISGRVPVDVTFPTTQPVSGPLTDTELRASALPVSGTVTLPPATTSTLSTFTATTNTQILAANSSRDGLVLSSPSTNTGICYVVIGTTAASSTSFSFVVNPGDIINLAGINTALRGIWSAGGNTLYVTELT